MSDNLLLPPSEQASARWIAERAEKAWIAMLGEFKIALDPPEDVAERAIRHAAALYIALQDQKLI